MIDKGNNIALIEVTKMLKIVVGEKNNIYICVSYKKTKYSWGFSSVG